MFPQISRASFLFGQFQTPQCSKVEIVNQRADFPLTGRHLPRELIPRRSLFEIFNQVSGDARRANKMSRKLLLPAERNYHGSEMRVQNAQVAELKGLRFVI